jgi:hypothetical protein
VLSAHMLIQQQLLACHEKRDILSELAEYFFNVFDLCCHPLLCFINFGKQTV